MPARRILLVDDHAAFRVSASALLAAEGCPVASCAASGEEALALLDAVDPDVVLVDLVLPGIDGVEVAELLAARARPPAVILISSHEGAAAEPRVAGAPVRGFLPKRELGCSAIAQLLR